MRILTIPCQSGWSTSKFKISLILFRIRKRYLTSATDTLYDHGPNKRKPIRQLPPKGTRPPPHTQVKFIDREGKEAGPPEDYQQWRERLAQTQKYTVQKYEYLDKIPKARRKGKSNTLIKKKEKELKALAKDAKATPAKATSAKPPPASPASKPKQSQGQSR